MRDYEGFDPIQEEGLLRRSEVEELRRRLEDLVDRLYVENEIIDKDEIDCDLRAMGVILGVYVPKVTIKLRGKLDFEYMEDVINENLYNIERLYARWDANAAFSHLKTLKMDNEHDILSVGDLADFCFSDYFRIKCKEAGSVF